MCDQNDEINVGDDHDDDDIHDKVWQTNGTSDPFGYLVRMQRANFNFTPIISSLLWWRKTVVSSYFVRH